jgi:hypothetical protein
MKNEKGNNRKQKKITTFAGPELATYTFASTMINHQSY